MNITENTKTMLEGQIISNKYELQEVQKKYRKLMLSCKWCKMIFISISEIALWSDVVQQVVDSKFEGVQSNLSNVEKSIEETRKKALQSSNVATCNVPRTCTTLGDRSFTAAGPHLWNNLSLHLRDFELSLSEFRRLLKTHLFG